MSTIAPAYDLASRKFKLVELRIPNSLVDAHFFKIKFLSLGFIMTSNLSETFFHF